MTQLVISLVLLAAMILLAGRWASAKQRRQREATGSIDHSEVRHARDHR
jgi:hypothetical protein